jgi:hypothetical protein
MSAKKEKLTTESDIQNLATEKSTLPPELSTFLPTGKGDEPVTQPPTTEPSTTQLTTTQLTSTTAEPATTTTTEATAIEQEAITSVTDKVPEKVINIATKPTEAPVKEIATEAPTESVYVPGELNYICSERTLSGRA